MSDSRIQLYLSLGLFITFPQKNPTNFYHAVVKNPVLTRKKKNWRSRLKNKRVNNNFFLVSAIQGCILQV